MSGANCLAVEEHGRFVFFALTNNNHTVHLDGIDQLTHGVNGGTIARFLLPASNPTSRGKCCSLGYPYQFHGEIAVWFGKILFSHREACLP